MNCYCEHEPLPEENFYSIRLKWQPPPLSTSASLALLSRQQEDLPLKRRIQ
jgi:hypothetical protein